MLFKKAAACRKLAVLLLLSCTLAKAQGGLELAGLAVYTDTARDIYVAGLQTPDGQLPVDTSNFVGPMTMEYRVATRRISSRGFSGTLLLQAELGSGQRAPEAVIDVLGSLKQQIKSSLASGDQFQISLTSGGNTRFVLNGSELLNTEGSAVFRYLAQGWMGDSASALLRDRLMAGSLDDDVMLRYESLIPLSDRVEMVAGWVEEAPGDEAEAAAVAQVATISTVAETETVPSPPAVANNTEPASEVAAKEETLVVATLALVEPSVGAPASTDSAPAATASVAPAVDESVADVSSVQASESQLASLEPVSGQPQTEALGDIDDREYQRQLSEYVVAVMNQVFKNVRYPRRAVKRELEGQVEVLAELSQDGELLGVSMETSSGHELLDKAAIRAVEGATPFPELSFVAREEFVADSGDNYVMLIPVKFMLN